MKTLNEIKEKLARSMTFQGHNQTENKFDTIEINRIVRALDFAISQANYYIKLASLVSELSIKSSNERIEDILQGKD